MAYQTVFKRYELKYLIDTEKKEKLLRAMEPHMIGDKYGASTVRNVYFDTTDYRMIRRSIEKPIYKEKLRIRSYRTAEKDSTVFVELKKKWRDVVYKRRLSAREDEAMDWICGKGRAPSDTQISREIDYLLHFYGGVIPTLFLSYDREAFYSREDPDLRITLDRSILCRTGDLSLRSRIYGTSLISPELTLMEIKCSGGIPLWLTRVLTEEGIRKASFSKYGTAYRELIFPTLKSKKEDLIHA